MREERIKKSKKNYPLVFLIITFYSIITLHNVYAQSDEKIINIIKTNNQPKIDGVLNDECWSKIEPVSGFFQFDPVNGVKASEETFVWAAYDDENIYFAFFMEDSRPDKIYAELTPRNRFSGNDSITVILDTYYDKRTSFTFSLNPKGIQANSVETIWHGAATIKEKGWTAEIAIPFKSLRFPKNNNQIWGVNFKRYIHRLKETNYWTKVGRDEPLLQKSGIIKGLENIKPRHNIEFFPYTGYRHSIWEEEKDIKFASGLDFKYGITSNLVLDLSVSPDYSEIESDPFIYQLSPYEIRFFEYRPFFSEGSQYFRTRYDLFYSRRIENPEIAAKLTGKFKGYSFGILGANNRGSDGNDSLFSIFRVKKDILKNSEMGFYFTGLDQNNLWNRNASIDFNFRLKNIYFINGQTAFSYNSGIENRNNGMYALSFFRSPDAGVNFSFRFDRIEKDVNVRTGFIYLKDYQNFSLDTGYSWRFNKKLIKYLEFSYGGYYREDPSGNPTGKGASLFSSIEFINQSRLFTALYSGESKRQIFKNGKLAWSDYFFPNRGFFLNYFFFRGKFIKGYGLGTSLSREPVYTENFTRLENGTTKSLYANLNLRPFSFLELSFNSGFIEQRILKDDKKIFSGTTFETSMHYQITKSLFFNTRIKGESRYDQYNMDMLLGYYFGASNIIQLSYKKSSRIFYDVKEGGYSLTLKVSYLLRI